MSAAIFVAARRSRCRRVDAIMDSVCQCGSGEKSVVLGNLNCRSESYGQMNDNFYDYNVLGDCDDV